MTTRYTNEEWASIISDAQSHVLEKKTTYRAPMIGSVVFAKYIDHTLLKPESTKEQIDQLCDEASRHSFKVSTPYYTKFLLTAMPIFIGHGSSCYM